MAAISLFALGTYTKAIFYTKTTPAASLLICNIYCAEYSSSSSSGIVFSTFRSSDFIFPYVLALFFIF